MACMYSPVCMEFFLYCHWGVDIYPRSTAPAVKEATNLLLKEGMIQLKKEHLKEGGNPFELTPKGVYFKDYVLHIPFPTETTVYNIQPPKQDSSFDN